MREVSKESSFFFPFTEVTTKTLYKRVIVSAINGINVTFSINDWFGGGRAIPMFFSENFDYLNSRWNFNLGKCKFVFINPDELERFNKFEYLKLIYQNIGGEYKGKNYFELVRSIRNILVRSKTRVIIFLRAFNYLDFADKNFWGSFRSIVSGIDRVSIVFIGYSGGISLNDERFVRIKDLLNQNHVKLNLLKEDIYYLINRWGYIYERDFSSTESDVIANMSCGSPMLIKNFCTILAGNRNTDNPRKLILEKYGTDILLNMHLFNYGENSGEIGCLSKQEKLLFELLRKNSGKLVTKEEIAQTLWKSRVLEKYSEQAIAQLIKRVRDKLFRLHISRDTIHTLHSKGYIYSGGLL